MSEQPVVGIDLGTSNTVVAVISGSKAVVIPDSDGRRIHPSVISFHPNGSVLVGQEAKRRRIVDPTNTIYSVKRFIGRPFRAEQTQAMVKRCAYPITEGENQAPLITARGNTYTVEEMSAFILRHVRALAEAYIGQRIEHAVITVPANFNDTQREATRTAGRIAGLEVMRVLNEPTAAALAYGYGRGMTSRVVIYDFGGGTFDVTALQLNDRVFEVQSTAGDTFLGGDDIDEQIVDYMIDIFLRQTRVDLRYNAGAMARLRSVAEQIKCQLSSRPKAVVQVQEIAYGEGGEPLDLNFTLTIDALNAMARELVQRSFLICDEAMKLAELSSTQIDDVVLVGGSTRMPLVRDGVKGYFDIDPRTDINPDEVVAVGAAIQGAALMRSAAAAAQPPQPPPLPPSSGAGEASPAASPPPPPPPPQIDAVLLDVTPRALGIAVVGGYAETIIERNAQIPIDQTRRFTTSQDNQTVVRLQVCQGESRLFDENQALGELVLEQLPPAPRGKTEVEVTFEIDTNGILQVSAIDVATGRRQRAQVRLLGTVSEEQIAGLTERQDKEMPAR